MSAGKMAKTEKGLHQKSCGLDMETSAGGPVCEIDPGK